MEAALKILTVDDEKSITQSMRFIFSGPQYQVTGAESGVDALKKLETSSSNYDVIIIDEKMPHLTGVELVQEIKKRRFAGQIMVLSAHLSPEVRAAYKEMDVHVLLDKPFDIHDLRTALDHLSA